VCVTRAAGQEPGYYAPAATYGPQNEGYEASADAAGRVGLTSRRSPSPNEGYDASADSAVQYEAGQPSEPEMAVYAPGTPEERATVLERKWDEFLKAQK